MLQHNSRLGEVWKVCGGSSALGGWVPEVAPALAWNDGGIWSAEIALPPGTYSFKCMLRRADGSYIWEAGENRHLMVSAVCQTPEPQNAAHHWDTDQAFQNAPAQPGTTGIAFATGLPGFWILAL